MDAIHGCTLATPRYEAHARVLAESFLARHPGARFSVLMIGYPPETLPEGEGFEVLVPADVGIDEQELNRRATMYMQQGLTSSMKPHLLATLLSRGADSVIYIDADGYLYDELTGLAELAARHSLLLSPHSLDPHPIPASERPESLWREDSPEQIIMRAGVMNAGLIGVGPGAGPFLEWWSRRISRRCVFDEAHGLMLCQTWLTLATALFEHHVLRDRGCNVAGWNLQARDVRWEGGTPTIDGVPLRHFHFAGSFDPEQPHLITPIAKHASWWTSLEERPGTARVVREYADRLIAHGYRRARATRPLYDAMPDGHPIEPWMRESYRAALVDAEEGGAVEPPNPFDDGSERFLGWLEQRTAHRLDRRDRPPSAEGTLGGKEMTAALLDSAKLLARVRELEAIRDEAVSWAERASSELRDARAAGAAAEADRRELERMRATMESVWRSPSWRITRPLRAAKGFATRGAKRPGRSA